MGQVTIERVIKLEQERQIMMHNSHPTGCWAVLASLRKRLGEWVKIDILMAETGQRAIHSRISELVNKYHFNIEHNGHGGAESAYRLVTT